MNAKLTHDDVREILALLDASTFDELKIEMDDLKLELRRTARAVGAAAAAPAPEPARAAPAAPAPTAAPAPVAPSRPAGQIPAGLVPVAAPMLGIYYRAPKPGAEPFVTPGTRITAESIIGIIEVMKLMNPVPAGVSGEVVEIVAPDGELIEFGQPILLVKPD